MMDIVPELQEAIMERFHFLMDNDARIRAFNKKMEDGKASSGGVSLYARWIGECASQALEENVRPEKLPGGILYWNIAKRTVEPILLEAHHLVMDAAYTIQLQEDEKTGIGIKPIIPDPPQERIDALVNKLVMESEKAAKGNGQE